MGKKNKQKESGNSDKLDRKLYEDELEKLQTELVMMQSWVKQTGARIVVVFEGRDAAGKGGVIKRMVERVSPRIFRVVALPVPSDREKSQLYVQRYVQHLPAAGEVVIFDRSWYNRLGVEKVLGFCTQQQYEQFLRNCDQFEASIVRDGIILVKYWLSVSQEEQRMRFQDRIDDPMRQWKLSITDLESVRKWYEYSLARDAMFAATDSEIAPWHVIKSDDKRRARLNCIHHFLSLIPYEHFPPEHVEIPKVNQKHEYDDEASLAMRKFVPEKY